MENATKALLIAAAILLVVLILSLVLVGYNQVSHYYQEKHESTMIKQLTEFNKDYENYNRENIRGSDLISLMNRIIDYNQRQSYTEGTNYQRIEVTITLGNNLDEFKYFNKEDGRYDITYDSILPETNKPITNVSGNKKITSVSEATKLDKDLIKLTNAVNEQIGKLNGEFINEDWNIKKKDNILSEPVLQKLSSNIANIVLTETVENAAENESAQKDKLKREKIIRETLKIPQTIENEDGTKKEIEIDLDTIKKIEIITCKYYEYTQFKRAYFDCIKTEYDTDTGRICRMDFKFNGKFN